MSQISNRPVDWETLVKENEDRLYRAALAILGDAQEAEDAVQDTFLRALRAWPGFRGDCAVETWLVRIAINVCKDYLRSAWNRRVSVVEALNEIPAAEDSPHEDDTLLREIMNLKPKYKEVILLFYYQDMKISEIARVLDAPESTVSVRLKRAREQLKKRLEGWYADGK